MLRQLVSGKVNSEFKPALRHCLRWVMFKMLDNEIVASEFEIQSPYYVDFWTNTSRKGMDILLLLDMGQIMPLLFF